MKVSTNGAVRFRKSVPRSYRGTERGHRGQCGLMFKAGEFVGPGSGPYQICLSENQTLDLFGVSHLPLDAAQDAKLGCGSWACVWERPDGKAVKITRDVDDIAAFQAAGVVKGINGGRPIPNVIKVYKQRELVGAGRDLKTGKPIQLWAQVTQKVDPIPPRYEDWIKNRFCRMRISLLTDVQRHRSEKAPNASFKPSGKTSEKVDKACAFVRDPRQRGECRKFGHGLIHTFSELYRRGVYWIDMNENNIGIDDKTGKWYGFDLGISDVALAARPKELRGPARRRR